MTSEKHSPTGKVSGVRIPLGVVVIWFAILLAVPVTVMGTRSSDSLMAVPGPASTVVVGGAVTDTSHQEGKFLFTTVDYRTVTWLRLAISQVTGQHTVPRAREVHENTAPTTDMAASKRVALAVALARINGQDQPLTTPMVTQVLTGSVAEQAGLVIGDRILAVDGVRQLTSSQLVSALQRRISGVQLSVSRGEETRTVQVPGTGQVGVRVETVPVDTLPDITFESGKVGGASAGLMFTLGALDALTPGDLTGGHTIAGTGTIQPDGSVGMVLGVDEKIEGARRSRATVFFSPSGANRTQGGVSIVSVTSLDTALHWLCLNGSTPACSLESSRP